MDQYYEEKRMAEVVLYHHVQGLTDGVRAFAADVRSGAFPADAESYHGSEALRDGLAAR